MKITILINHCYNGLKVSIGYTIYINLIYLIIFNRIIKNISNCTYILFNIRIFIKSTLIATILSIIMNPKNCIKNIIHALSTVYIVNIL